VHKKNPKVALITKKYFVKVAKYVLLIYKISNEHTSFQFFILENIFWNDDTILNLVSQFNQTYEAFSKVGNNKTKEKLSLNHYK